MIAKFKSIVFLTMVGLLFTSNLYATEADTESSTNSSVDEKFQRLQKEMENDPAKGITSGSGSGKSTATLFKDNDSSIPKGRSVGSLAFQIILGLIFVLLLAVVTIRLLKRMQGRLLAKPLSGGKTNHEFFEVLETCHLGTHQKIVALRIHDEIGVLGVTQQGISLITLLKEPAQEVRQAYFQGKNSEVFSENLNKILERFKKPKRVSDLLDEAKG